MNIKRIGIISTIFLFAISSLTVAALYYAPSYLQDKIQHDYPGVTVTKVSLYLDKVVLEEVLVNKPGLEASLPYVEVSYSKAVTIHGGHVTITKSKETKADSVKEHNIQAYDLTATVIDTTKNIKASLKSVNRSSDGLVTVGSGTVSGDVFGTAAIEGLTYGKTISVDSVAFSPKKKLPIEGPIVAKKVKATKGDAVWDVTADFVKVQKNEARGVHVLFEKQDKLEITAASVTANHQWLSPEPVVFGESHLNVNGKIISAMVGKVTVVWDGETLSGDGDCQDLANAFPQGLKEPLEGLDLGGRLEFSVNIKKPVFLLKGFCRAACNDKLKALRKPFKYLVYNKDGTRSERETGPTTREWATLPGTYLPEALITMEDPGFQYHRGWSPAAFEASLKENLTHKKFVRGGSTLTMQLVKNIWLNRNKTLGRKAQEVILANAVESCFSKDEIIELYLNVVEFGPNLYGITNASQRYFGTSPYALTPKQAFWLASILPAPHKAGMPDEAAMKRISNLMKLLNKNGRLPEEMLEDDEPKAEEPR
jgi:hypothetical protein